MTQNLRVTLIKPGQIVPELHYGPYSFYWWVISEENDATFPIRLGQQTKVQLSGVDFVITIQTGFGSTKLMPMYCCQSGFYVVKEPSSTKAISTVYKNRFNNSTRYSGYQAMGWNDKNILEILKQNIQYIPVTVNVESCDVFIYSIGTSLREKWRYAGSGFQSSLLHMYERKQSIFVSRIEEKKCIVEIYRECTLIKQFIGATPDEVWKKTGQLKKFTGTQLFGLDSPITENLIQQHRIPDCTPNDWHNDLILKQLFDYHVKRRTVADINWKYFFTSWAESENPIIELEPALRTIYPKRYEFSERELGAWRIMLKAVGATNITPWSCEESQSQFWTKSPNGEADKVAFATLYQKGFLTSTPKNMSNATCTFWMCFERALANNKKTPDGKRRILSIISNEFTYDELKRNLNVGAHTILESRKHARINGYGAPPLVKPIICRQRFTPEMLEQIDRFLNDKEFVNMSSYKTDAKTGKPIKYLQDTKKALWKRFAEEYPNGMRRTSFMTCLEGGQYVYRENLGGLCSTCNDCGYMVFGDIGVMISAHVTDESLKKHLLTKSQELRRYIRREYSKELEVTAAGIAIHNSCISHCIRHAFGDCDLDHSVTCSKCESLFSFFEELKAAISEEYFEILDEYQQKLIAWMAHHARKTYLNIHVRTNLEELDGEGAVMIVDYKMRILPQSARETKTEFFGKRGWSFHSVLVYTKNVEQNQLDVQVFDHWSDDTRQDAWFTASSLHTVIETMNPKPRKWIFLEAGEAKTAIDSHHAQVHLAMLSPRKSKIILIGQFIGKKVSQAMKRYVKLGYDVDCGNDIESAVKDIAGVQVANLNPNRSNDKAKLGTITGISNLQEWTWPTDEENVGYIYARALPGIGEWKKWSPEKLEKIVKKRKIEKPNPTFTPHTQSTKQWTMSISNKENKQPPIQGETNQILVDLTNLENNNDIGSTGTKSQQVFTSGWALKEKEKSHRRGPIKRMSLEVKQLLESMFHTGTANPRQKLNAQQMHEELLRRAELGEIEDDDIPKVATITNWISTFSRKWKEAMALRSLEENMD